MFSYANNIPTGEGGSHETGFKAAFTKACWLLATPGLSKEDIKKEFYRPINHDITNIG